MHRNYFLAIVFIAFLSLLLTFFIMWQEVNTPERPPTSNLPQQVAFASSISGVGIVEPSSDNISISTPLNRIVKKVYVTVGQKVKKNDLLFSLENSDLQADLRVHEASYNSALAKLKKLESYPRSEDLTIATATVAGAKTELDSAKEQYEMVLNLPDPRAISQQEKDRRFFQYQQAQAHWQKAQADLEKIKTGSWQPDIDIANYEIEEMKANIDRIKADIEQTFVRSPIEGTVLQLKIHEGELPSVSNRPLLILGNTDEKVLRVSINQLDIPLFHGDSPAIAYLQGKADVAYPLEFIRLEPLLVSKRNLSNAVAETVDTRVLEIIYLIKKDDPRIFIGQQMDVIIKTKDAQDDD